MSKENPSDPKDKMAPRIEPEIESDTNFSADEQKEIGRFVKTDTESGLEARVDWETQRQLDIKHYNNEKPSILENLSKKKWMSDRNLGLCPATCDIFQATLLATTFNPDTINFRAVEKNDVDNRENLTKFAKWVVGPAECNVFSEVDEFIHNRITQGVSFIKIWWKVWYEWVDKRIPKYKGIGPFKKFSGYTIKTEKVRFEKGVLENISDVDDIILPNYGKKLQGLPWITYVLHITGADLLDYSERKIFINLDQDNIEKIKNAAYEFELGKLGKEKAAQIGIQAPGDITKYDLRDWPVDVYEYYGMYEKGGRNERYRFHVVPSLGIFLAGKPLRKIRRDGKYPFVGGPFIRVPGKILGKSLPSLIAPVVNAFNNVFNQKSDFQYFENCPDGWYKPDEQYTIQNIERVPGVYYPTDDPSSVVTNHGSRSMAWATDDKLVLFELLERLTGAASYFMSNRANSSGTATRDTIITEKSETRFGLWVKRIIVDVSEGIGMLTQEYQEWAPEDIFKRVLGEDSKPVVENLSIETLRGNYDCYMSPDIIAGSRTLEREIYMWATQNLNASPWMDPRINPAGSWQLWVDTAKKMGMLDAEKYFPPKPDGMLGSSEEVKNEFHRIKQGERIDPPEGVSAQAMEHYLGHMKQKMENYHEIDDEYKPLFDEHLFKTQVNLQKFMSQIIQEQMADKLAMQMIYNRENFGGENAQPDNRAGGAGGNPAFGGAPVPQETTAGTQGLPAQRIPPGTQAV